MGEVIRLADRIIPRGSQLQVQRATPAQAGLAVVNGHLAREGLTHKRSHHWDSSRCGDQGMHGQEAASGVSLAAAAR